jgi:AraC-like DNA-binding protein
MTIDPARRSFLPFEHYSLVETSSIDALEHAVSREIGPHDFSFLQRRRQISSRISCVRLQQTRLFGVNFGAAVKANKAASSDLQLVLPLAGTVVRHDGQAAHRAGGGRALFIPPGAPSNVDFNRGCVAAIVWVDARRVEYLAQTALGMSDGSQLRFPDTIDLRRGVGLSIANLSRMIMTELGDEASLFSRGIISRSIEENLLLALVHSAAHRSVGRVSWDGNKALRAAVDYIHAHLKEEIGVMELTQTAGVSLRKLQYDFTRVFGQGPMAMIRNEKLKRIRAELERGDPYQTSVAEVAARWSFFDRGYLTRIYKKTFGETPSATLERRDVLPRVGI